MIGSVRQLRHLPSVRLAAAAVLLSTALDWGSAGLGVAGARSITLPDGPPATVTVAGSDVQLDWTTVPLRDGHNASSYRVARTAPGGTASTAGGTCVGAVAAVTCTDAGVPEGYWQYAVAVVQGAWEGAAGPAVTAAVPLDAPTGLTGTLAGSDLTLSWTDQSDLETGYRIERSTDAGATWATAADVAAASTSHVLTGLACDTTYQHRVVATHADAVLTSASSGAVTTVAPSCTPQMSASIFGRSTGVYNGGWWGRQWDAWSYVTVVDQHGAPVKDATVNVRLILPDNGSWAFNCVTDVHGRCSVLFGGIDDHYGYVGLFIWGLSKPGYEYTRPPSGAPGVRVHQAAGYYHP